MKLASMFTSSFAAAVLLTSLSSGAAMIKSNDVASVKVDTSGIDITTKAGQALLQAKLQQAAKEVCDPRRIKETGSFATSFENRVCVRDAVDNAMKSIGISSMGDSKHADNS